MLCNMAATRFFLELGSDAPPPPPPRRGGWTRGGAGHGGARVRSKGCQCTETYSLTSSV